jgi:hypothetical protein
VSPEIVNQLEALTYEHHFVIKAVVPLEVQPVIATPSFQIVVLSFKERETLVDIAISRLSNLKSLYDQRWRTIPVKGNIVTPNNGHRFPLRSKFAQSLTCSGFLSRSNQTKQLVAQFFIVSERESNRIGKKLL